MGDTSAREKDAAGENNEKNKTVLDKNLTNTAGSTSTKKPKGWKRREHEDSEVQSNTSLNMVVQGQAGLQGAGVKQPRMELHDDINVMEPPAKKCTFQGPTLSECLGKEGLEKLRAAELNAAHFADNEYDSVGNGLVRFQKWAKVVWKQPVQGLPVICRARRGAPGRSHEPFLEKLPWQGAATVSSVLCLASSETKPQVNAFL